MSIEEYKSKEIYPHPSGTGYLGEQIGTGLIQFLHSRVGRYVEGCLGNGRLATTYDPKVQPEMDHFFNTIWKILKKNALKVYLIDRETGKVSEKPESRFYAFPDAAAKFNGTNGQYLTCGALTFFVAR